MKVDSARTKVIDINFLLFSVSNLGELVLLEPGLRTDLMMTCMQGLRGHDSISGTKAAALVELMLPK